MPTIRTQLGEFSTYDTTSMLGWDIPGIYTLRTLEGYPGLGENTHTWVLNACHHSSTYVGKIVPRVKKSPTRVYRIRWFMPLSTKYKKWEEDLELERIYYVVLPEVVEAYQATRKELIRR